MDNKSKIASAIQNKQKTHNLQKMKRINHFPSSIPKTLCIRLLLIALSMGSSGSLFAQKEYTLQGNVVDAATKESLIGVNIIDIDTKKGTTTNTQGEFKLISQTQIITIRCSYLGYKDSTLTIDLAKSAMLNIALVADSKVLAEILVESLRETPKEKVNSMLMSADKISMEEAKMLPALFGEVDIIKILQLKPGVKSAGEGTAGFFVRGGGSDQNLILVSRAPVYNPNHLLGFFSVFNADAVKEVSLYKAGFPAQYGGRLSSVLDVTMQNGNAQKWAVQGGLGLISSRLTLNVPLKKDKLSLLLSGRRTYFDVFTRLSNRLNENNPEYSPIPTYYFYDFNIALEFKPSAKNRFQLNGYLGDDFFRFSRTNFGANLVWGNRTATISWQHTLHDRLSVNNAYFLSGYLYRINNRFASNSLSLGSSIADQGLLSDWTWEISDKQQLQWGASGIYHRFSVGEFGLSTDFTDIQSGQQLKGLELGFYLAHQWQISKNVTLLSGLRNSYFLTQETSYSGLEPRFSLKYNLNEGTTLKASYARMYQYLHLVSNSAASLPTDVWYPSAEGVKPQFSDQIALGLHKALRNDIFFFSLETYYKWIGNAIDFKDGAQLFANPNLATEFVFGRGWAYGIEAYIEKKLGRTTGWIGYTWGWTWRQFAEINEGKPFQPRFDRRHDVSVVLMHQLSPRVRIGSTWAYGTGNFTTIAGGRFVVQDILRSPSITPEFLGRNDYQMPASHRLDLSLVWQLKPKRGKSDLTFSLYNVYSRRNPYFIFYEEAQDETTGLTTFTPTLASLFPILPSVTYNFKF